jgi:cell division protein FtsB
MLDFKEKKQIKKIFYSKITLVILLLLVIFMFKSVLGVYRSAKETNFKKEETNNKLIQLQEREQELSEDVDTLNTERGIEEEIRSKFKVVKEGEKIIMLIDREETAKDIKLNQKSNTFWENISDFFKF